ncbi:hypothetical protein ACFCV3_10285 [Kribbella sp. NPDC056345]|uniref:hypothetical protein n=1 Tax=Kribbella sp. NPDC056345 TaxID=3345789 RepID=UPI0035E31406
MDDVRAVVDGGEVSGWQAAIALALLVVSTGPAAAAAERYIDAAATLDGKWKSLGSYYRNLDGTTDDRLCVRTYNSMAGARSFAAIKDANTGEFYAWVFDNSALDGEPACTPRRDFRLTG